jgi:uncharacterized membrane protein YfcA
MEILSLEFLGYVLAGFAAQLIDGALGMAYGITATSLLLATGVPPAAASATVHAAECFTTGASAISHRAFGNIDGFLFRRLLIPGICGAAVGAWFLSNFPGDALKPWIAGYLLLMGVVIFAKAFRRFPPREVTTHLAPLGFFGALIDAIGGGGWGPIVATNLIARGKEARFAIGSVNAVEFFVTLTASITFVISLGVVHGQIILGLAIGGVAGAPIGAWACKRANLRVLMVFTALLVIALSVRTLLLHFAD